MEEVKYVGDYAGKRVEIRYILLIYIMELIKDFIVIVLIYNITSINEILKI